MVRKLLFELLSYFDLYKNNTISEKLGNFTGEHMNPDSPLSCLNFIVTDLFITISTDKISDSLRHINPYIDRVLHQMNIAVFDKKTLLPIFYLEKSIKNSNKVFNDGGSKKSYLGKYLYDKFTRFNEIEFDNSVVSVYNNYIGSYMILFYHEVMWYFMFSGNIYPFTNDNHPILYQHLRHSIDKLDKKYCYHIILVDSRLCKLINIIVDKNYVLLVKMSEKETLIDHYDNPYTFFVTNKRIYMSCMDDLLYCLDELDNKNVSHKKLLYRGYIVKIKVDSFEELYVSYNTKTYDYVLSMIPKGLKPHEVYLKLYQDNKLNHYLSFFSNSYDDIIKRINTSMVTMSREILEIYHMTRKKRNTNLYKLLPQSYRQILCHLHTRYISRKCSINDTDDFFDPRMSISVDNVYDKLKVYDTLSLVQLYKDRDVLINSINQSSDIIVNPIKYCTNTKIQSKLLGS